MVLLKEDAILMELGVERKLVAKVFCVHLLTKYTPLIRTNFPAALEKSYTLKILTSNVLMKMKAFKFKLHTATI